MAKKVLYESAIHHFLTAARRLWRLEAEDSPERDAAWRDFLASLRFEYPGYKVLRVCWSRPAPGALDLSFAEASLYLRGDGERRAREQREAHLTFADDTVMEANERRFLDYAARAGRAAGLILAPRTVERIGV